MNKEPVWLWSVNMQFSLPFFLSLLMFSPLLSSLHSFLLSTPSSLLSFLPLCFRGPLAFVYGAHQFLPGVFSFLCLGASWAHIWSHPVRLVSSMDTFPGLPVMAPFQELSIGYPNHSCSLIVCVCVHLSVVFNMLWNQRKFLYLHPSTTITEGKWSPKCSSILLLRNWVKVEDELLSVLYCGLSVTLF